MNIISQKDLALKKYFSNDDRFLDMVNGIMFHGESHFQTILSKEDPVSIFKKNNKLVERKRDLLYKLSCDGTEVYLNCEHQMSIHYAMPVRSALYEVLKLDDQIQELKQRHRKQKDILEQTEFLSGMKKEEKIIPVITIICYYSNEEWDTHLSLKKMFLLPDTSSDIDNYLNDYRINLIPMMKINPEVFHTEFKQLIELL